MVDRLMACHHYFLNLKYPDLEESSELALKEPSSLNVLEKMQLAHSRRILEAVPLAKTICAPSEAQHPFIPAMLVFGWEITWLHGELGNSTDSDYPHLLLRHGKIHRFRKRFCRR